MPFPETYAKDRACLLVKNVRVRISLDYRLVNYRVTAERLVAAERPEEL